MLQLKIYKKNAGLVRNNFFYLQLQDEWITQDPDTKIVLFDAISQYTGKTQSGQTPVLEENERYWKVNLITTRGTSPAPSPPTILDWGTTDFPLGFYDISLYQDISGEKNILYTGTLNLTVDETNELFKGTPPVEYTEYTTNDEDTGTIYITNS
jgi:hypothetical protein